jgi:hypothetical protein
LAFIYTQNTHHHEREADAEEDEAQHLVGPRQGARPGEAEQKRGGAEGEEPQEHEDEADGDGLWWSCGCCCEIRARSVEI